MESILRQFQPTVRQDRTDEGAGSYVVYEIMPVDEGALPPVLPAQACIV